MKKYLYQVTYGSLCAAYVLEDNKVIECAPILKKKIDWWCTRGVLIAEY